MLPQLSETDLVIYQQGSGRFVGNTDIAYVAAGEGLAIATESMAACTFPGIVGLHRGKAELQLRQSLPESDRNDTGKCAGGH
jgi:hypothetical protein